MTIDKAIKEARKLKRRIYSNSLGMVFQDAKSLTHWMFVDRPADLTVAFRRYRKMLEATDWELHDEEDL